MLFWLLQSSCSSALEPLQTSHNFFSNRRSRYWTVKAMAERARHHPHRSSGMDAALEVLDGWLSARRAREGVASTAAPPPPPPEQRQQRQLLAASAANAHARARCASDAEHEALVAADRRTALAALRRAARDVPFPLPATAFVSLFGSPGDHGYGYHRCEEAATAGLAGWRCTCAFARRHVVDVSDVAAAAMRVGTKSSAFRLTFDGSNQAATLRGAASRGQSMLTAFFKKTTPTSVLSEAPPQSQEHDPRRRLRTESATNADPGALACTKRPRLQKAASARTTSPMSSSQAAAVLDHSAKLS